MRKATLIATAALACTLCTGCVRGLLFHNVTKPLVKDMDRTPAGTDLATLDSREIRIPRVHLNAVWHSRAIGDAARRAGLEEVHYADIKTFTILLGIWRQQTVRVWGKAKEPGDKQT